MVIFKCWIEIFNIFSVGRPGMLYIGLLKNEVKPGLFANDRKIHTVVKNKMLINIH